MSKANKLSNNYADAIDPVFYEECPKAVFAALAVSFAQRMGISFEDITNELREEWKALYEQQIVPQKAK